MATPRTHRISETSDDGETLLTFCSRTIYWSREDDRWELWGGNEAFPTHDDSLVTCLTCLKNMKDAK